MKGLDSRKAVNEGTRLSLSLSLSLESTPLGEGTDARAQKKAGSAPAIIKAFPEKRNSL